MDAVEKNLKKIVLEKNIVCESAKKQMFLKFGHFAPVVLMLQWFLCSIIYGKYFEGKREYNFFVKVTLLYDEVEAMKTKEGQWAAQQVHCTARASDIIEVSNMMLCDAL